MAGGKGIFMSHEFNAEIPFPSQKKKGLSTATIKKGKKGPICRAAILFQALSTKQTFSIPATDAAGTLLPLLEEHHAFSQVD